MLTMYTENQEKRIINSILKAIETGNINKLTKKAYTYLYLCSGFIAHYSYYGFIQHYNDVNDLRADILANVNWNLHTCYRPGEKDYEYYKQKADMYRVIAEKVSNIERIGLYA